jgi:hypothetical protein
MNMYQLYYIPYWQSFQSKGTTISKMKDWGKFRTCTFKCTEKCTIVDEVNRCKVQMPIKHLAGYF